MTVPGIAGNGTDLADGAELALAGKGYYYRAWGGSSYACVYCHANFDENKLDDGYWRPGHSLWNAADRPSYYNKTYDGNGDIPLARAVNTCVVAFLQVDALKLSDERMQALLAYIRSISPEEAASPVEITHVTEAPEMDGDPRKGEKLFASSCELCHREKGILPALSFNADSALVVAKIRGTKPPQDASGELEGDYPPMPFFSAERLSDQQVADVLAYWDHMKFIQAQKTQEDIEPEEVAMETVAGEPTEEIEDGNEKQDESGPAAAGD